MSIQSPFRICSSWNHSSVAKRIALAAVITGSAIVGSLSGKALAATSAHSTVATGTGGISILVHRFDESAQPIAPLVATPGTHDSAPMIALIKPELEADVEAEAEANVVAEPEIAIAAPAIQHRTSSNFNEMLAAAVASTAAKIGIPLEQFLEPFAMIQTQSDDPSPITVTQTELAPVAGELDLRDEDRIAGDSDLAEAVALNRWWLDETVPGSTNNDNVPRAEVVRKSTLDLREELAALAAEEPLDVTLPRVILPIVTKHDVSPIRVVKKHIVNDMIDRSDELVGSSPMIVTLEEAYFPYDLDPADIALIETVKASPDCMLDEAVHQTTQLANRVQAWSVADLGGVLASVSSRRVSIQADLLAAASDDIASMFATVVPMMLVDGEVVPQPTPDETPDTIHSIDTMVVAGEIIPAPVPDSVPDEISTGGVIDVMLVDGNLVPAPTPDEAPDAIASEPSVPLMLVDGSAIPAPTPDGIPNGMVYHDTKTGLESIVAVDVVPESAYPTLDPSSWMESKTQIATRDEDNVQR